MPTRKLSAKAKQLARLIRLWQSDTASVRQENKVANQIGRLISSRLRAHPVRYGWHDMHQECWLAVCRRLNAAPVKGSPSTMVFGVVDAVVMHEHECRTVNSWSATVEAVERMAHEHAKQRDTITHTPQYQRPQPPVVGTLGDEVRKRFIQSKVGSAIKLDENTP